MKRIHEDDITAKYKSSFDIFANPNILITGNKNHKS